MPWICSKLIKTPKRCHLIYLLLAILTVYLHLHYFNQFSQKNACFLCKKRNSNHFSFVMSICSTIWKCCKGFWKILLTYFSNYCKEVQKNRGPKFFHYFISCPCSISIPSKNMRKPLVFSTFLGVTEWNIVLKRVNRWLVNFGRNMQDINFYTLWKRHKTFCFLKFSGGIENGYLAYF